MITYDYTIDRVLGQGKSRRFIPEKIPTKLSDMVLIEGPNSSGKSTLLNIIASGLYGTRNPRINPKLQSKMNALINSEHQKVKFSFQIDSANDGLILASEKTDPAGNEIVVKESLGGKPFKILSAENFEKKYNLIYDIPDRPTERLHELLKELKDEQQHFGNRIKDFYFYLDKTIGQITSTRDPKHLEEIRKKLKDALERKKKIDEELKEHQKFLDLLEKRAYIQYYCDCSSEGEKLEREIQLLRKTIKYFNAGGKKKIIKLSKDRTAISTLQSFFKILYDKVTPLIASNLPKKELPRFKIWKEINPYQTETEDLNRAKFEAIYYEELFGAEIEKMRKGPSFKEASVWERVFQALKDFENSGLVIPELEVSLGKLVRIMKDEHRKSAVLVQKYQTMSQVVEQLAELKNNAKQLRAAREQLKLESVESEQLSEDAIDAASEQKQELEKMEQDQRLLATKCNEYYQRCLSKGIDEEKLENESLEELIKDIPHNEQLEEYLSLGEIHVIARIEALKTEIIDKRGESSGLEMFITQYSNEVENLEKQKPHKFEPFLDDLNLLLRKTDAMRQKLLLEFNTNLKNLMDDKVKKSDLSKDSSKSNYYREVSKYLAHRVGSFRHIDKIYKAKVVDLIEKVIITDSEETIHMIDMGTGQEQATYILSVLNVDAKNDPRKIIALFDEIAMMDDISLEPICLRLQELWKQNRLLLGILVQKGNQLSVRNLG